VTRVSREASISCSNHEGVAELETLFVRRCPLPAWADNPHQASSGWVIVGEPYWREEPSEDYLAAAEMTKDAFGTHADNVEAGEMRGLELVHTFVSSKDDWDQYEGLQWYAAADHARRHPDDPDAPELLERVDKAKVAYLRWGRDTVGWAIYVFRHRLSEIATTAA
jgi:hypothetical protein